MAPLGLDMALASAAVLVLGSWIGITIAPVRRWPRSSFLDPHRDLVPARSVPARAPRVVAVVPARDEEATLPRALPSLVAQEELERVVVVDDDSADRTAAIAESAGAIAIAAGPRPAGWSGKVHALARGVEWAAAIPSGCEWLLFSDADIEHRPGSIAALLDRAQEGRYDLVSVMARLHAGSTWERLLIPPFVYFFHLLYPFRLVRDPRSRVAAAAGGCVLIRKAALERAGGLAAIAGELIDDVALARAVKDSGGRVWLGLDPGIVSVRPYRGLGELWSMVARNAFVQLRFRWDLLVLVVAGIVLLFVSPPAFVAWGLLEGTTVGWSTAGAGLAAWTLQAFGLLPWVRHHRVPGLYAWTMPLAAGFYAAMTVSAGWNHLRRRTSTWRGRGYGVGRDGTLGSAAATPEAANSAAEPSRERR